LIAYRAMLDVPRELVLELARLLRAERRARGTRAGTRLLTCFRQALFVLVWMRTKGEVAVIGAGFGVPRATAYRYRDEGLRVLAAQAPDLHDALQEVAEQGWSHVVVDGKLIHTDRCAETTTSVKGETINAWYSGKHRAPGGNVQAVIRPDGLPIWVSHVAPGHLHDLTVAREAGAIGALNWAASQLDYPPWPTPATTAPARASRHRSSSPPTGRSSPRTTRPTTRCCARPAASANAASPCSPAAGAPSNASPSAPAASANSPEQHSCSHESRTSNYALLVEITSLQPAFPPTNPATSSDGH
jgi:hypothetical protein